MKGNNKKYGGCCSVYEIIKLLINFMGELIMHYIYSIIRAYIHQLLQ